jgi:predicted transcriptional regulator
MTKTTTSSDSANVQRNAAGLAASQALPDEVERARFLEAVRQGLRESEQGRGRPAETVFAEMKAKYGL